MTEKNPIALKALRRCLMKNNYFVAIYTLYTDYTNVCDVGNAQTFAAKVGFIHCQCQFYQIIST